MPASHRTPTKTTRQYYACWSREEKSKTPNNGNVTVQRLDLLAPSKTIAQRLPLLQPSQMISQRLTFLSGWPCWKDSPPCSILACTYLIACSYPGNCEPMSFNDIAGCNTCCIHFVGEQKLKVQADRQADSNWQDGTTAVPDKAVLFCHSSKPLGPKLKTDNPLFDINLE